MRLRNGPTRLFVVLNTWVERAHTARYGPSVPSPPRRENTNQLLRKEKKTEIVRGLLRHSGSAAAAARHSRRRRDGRQGECRGIPSSLYLPLDFGVGCRLVANRLTVSASVRSFGVCRV